MKVLRCDVLVVGAGPAGSSAARVATNFTKNILLVEKKGYPYKAGCGEALVHFY